MTVQASSPLSGLSRDPAIIDEMAGLYDTELTNLLDQLVPEREFTHRPRP